MKLHEVVAILSGKKTRATKLLTEAHHGWKQELINGISRSYEPLDAEGEKLPSESKRVQVRVGDVVKKTVEELVDYMDIVATQETGNTIAKADVVVEGKIVIKDAPVGLLLFLEKRLTDLHTFVSQFPTLPTDRDWKFSPEFNCNVTDPTQQHRTAKLPQNFVKFEPTQHQPGQSEIIYVDKVVGNWTIRYFSGAVTAKEQAEMLSRINKLQESVAKAREQANSTDVQTIKVGKSVCDYVFDSMVV